MRTRQLSIFVRVIAVVTAVLFFPLSANSAIFNCTTGDVTCLIDSIDTANGNGESDTINLEAGIYTLTNVNNVHFFFQGTGLPIITSDITIIGAGADLTIIERDDLAPFFRIFFVGPGFETDGIPSGTLTLKKLAIKGGLSQIQEFHGAGILNRGTLTVYNSLISENSVSASNPFQAHGAGLMNFGTASIGGSTIASNSTLGTGGGIENEGNLDINDSAIIVNSARAGGGLFNTGVVTITNTTIAQNLADVAVSGGGGLFNTSSGVITVINSTITDNSTAGAGGGIRTTAGVPVVLKNTILAGNSGSLSHPDCLGDLTSQDNNMIGVPTCAVALQPNDLTGDPGLGTLTSSGMPGSAHFPLLPDSVAIDAGDNASCPNFDQLGVSRPVDGDGDGAADCDIGAVEFLGTIVIGDCDTGVFDQLLNSGSTISEQIDDCAVMSANHGEFVSCVAQFTNELQSNGIISSKQREDIQSCAAQADLP